MEENKREHFDNSVIGIAETVVVAYVAMKACQGVFAVTRNVVNSVRTQKADKAA